MGAHRTFGSGQWGDSPQARGLIEELSGVGHVIMDAAYDADHPRIFIADDLGAMVHIKRNPTCREDRPIEWMPYNECHLVECFFNKLKSFRRTALHYEKAVTSFKALVDFACAMVWIS